MNVNSLHNPWCQNGNCKSCIDRKVSLIILISTLTDVMLKIEVLECYMWALTQLSVISHPLTHKLTSCYCSNLAISFVVVTWTLLTDQHSLDSLCTAWATLDWATLLNMHRDRRLPQAVGASYMHCTWQEFQVDNIRVLFIPVHVIINNSEALVRERTIPTEQPLVDEISANCCR
jgi:hypothetical protein